MQGFLGTVSGRITTHEFSFTAQAKVKKFQYIKLYHEEAGFILAQVIGLLNEQNSITVDCEIIGYRDSRNLLRVPNTTVSSGGEVYDADSEFIKKVLGLEQSDGLYLGLLDNYNMIRVKLDAQKLVTKHLAVLAKTGAGKSYTLGVIVEELLENGIPIVIIDPHGEYSSLRYANSNSKELELMHRYDVKEKAYADKIVEYSPNTEINTSAKPLFISINSLNAQEIATLTPMKIGGTQLGLLYNAINEVKKDGNDYTLDDIRANLDTINSNAKYGIYACLDFLENVGVFSTNPVKVEQLVNPGKATLVNLKGVSPDIQRIMVAKICSDLFEKRKKNLIPPLFLIIEEAHNFCPERSFGESPSSYILRNIASEGRKFGLGLGIVSQRPARVDKNVLSQCNTQIIQKVTNPNDLKAISSSAENISSSVVDDIATLPIGVALVVGASAKPVMVDVRVKKTEHGGKSVRFNPNKTYESPKVEPIIEEPMPEPVYEAPKPESMYEPPRQEPIIEETKYPIISLGINQTVPCFLASINKGYDLLLTENNQILIIENNALKAANLNQNNLPSGLGQKAENIMKIINQKGNTSVTYLFNSLNYSFQDVNFILRDLQEKELIKINGSNISLNNNIDFHNFAWTKNIVMQEMDEKIEHSVDENSVKSFLESKGLVVNEIRRVYVK